MNTIEKRDFIHSNLHFADDILKDFKEAENQIRAGNFLTLEEMEREAENW